MPVLLAALLGLAALYLGAAAVGSVRLWRAPAGAAAGASPLSVAPAPAIPGLAGLAEAPLFGRYVPPRALTPAAPPTALALTLHAVFLSPVAGASYALIGSPGTPPRPFAVAQSLPDGTVVGEVLADRVILQRNGGYETLSFERAGR